MKKLLVLFILLTIFLSGCVFDLDNWVMPNDAEFIALVQELDTPEKIGDYMTENFTYEQHLYISLTPYQLYKIKKGDCNDFATFAIFIADYHEYETYLIKIFYKNTIYKHWLAIYKENNYSFSSNQHYFSDRYDTFLEIVKWYSRLYGRNWSKYIVYDYWNDIVEQGTK